MEGFLSLICESAVLVFMVLAIRRIFIGKVRYAVIYAMWFVVMLRFMIPVNLIPLPVNLGHMLSEKILSEVNEPDNVSENEYASNIGFVSVFSEDTESRADMPAVHNYVKLKDTDIIAVLRECRIAVSVMLFLLFVISNTHMYIRIRSNRRLYRKLYTGSNPLKVYTVSGIDNPCLYGLFAPAVYIPDMLVNDTKKVISKEELEQIIVHEYVHYKHKDHIWAVIRMILLSLYWYNPVLWIAVSYFKRDTELFCDEAVVSVLGDERRFDYGEMLVRLAGEKRIGDFRYLAVSMSRSGKEMEKRIRAISDKRQYHAWIVIPFTLIVLSAVAVTCSTGVSSFAGENKTEVTYDNDDSSIDILKEKDETEPGEIQSKDSKKDNGEDGYVFLYDHTGMEAAEDVHLYNAATYEEAFENYINVFTEAVNTGDTYKLPTVLAPQSEVCKQQTGIVKNYYSRGIHEEIKSYSITSENLISDSMVTVDSKEKIKVTYADASERIVKQRYRYTCEIIDGGWIITAMNQINDK